MIGFTGRATMTYVTHHQLTNSQVRSVLPKLGALLRQWWRRLDERDQLAKLGERDLHDLGLSRAAVYAELRKPFWRA
jgi:uncharacterized protein YjiS (DUF1127 family)